MREVETAPMPDTAGGVLDRPPLDRIDFLVLSYPRSGSSLLRRIINQGSSAVIPPESAFATWIPRRAPGAVARCNAGRMTHRDLSTIVTEIASSRKFEHWGLTAGRLRDRLAGGFPSSYPQLLAAVYECFAIDVGRTDAALGDKNNSFFFEPERALRDFGRPPVLLLFRDPAGVWASYKRLAGLPPSSRASRYFPAVPDSVDAFCSEWADGYTAVIETTMARGIRTEITFYDDLIDAPDAVVGRLQRLTADSDRQVHRRREQVQSRRLDEPAEFTAWKSNVALPPDRAAQLSRSELLSTEEVEVIRSRTEGVVGRLREMQTS